jgi:hypothetical protein
MRSLSIFSLLLLSSLYLPFSFSIHIHNMSSYHSVIVAVRYKDPLPTEFKYPLWFSKYPHIIYNRGHGEFAPIFNTIDLLENCGREGYVYLLHLYENYDNLPEITIFAQYDHLLGEKECPDVTAIMADGKMAAINDGFAFVGNRCLDDRVRVFLYGYERWGKTNEDVKNQMDTMFGPGYAVPNPRYIPTAFFAVTREAVHRNPRDFYRKLAHLLNYDENPWQGHFIERSWPEIFKSQCGQQRLFCCKFVEPYCAKEEEFVQLTD